MASYAGLDLLAGTRPSGGEGSSRDAEDQEFEYPVPLFVKNTFIDAQVTRPASLEGFIHERQAFSCPTSLISPPGSDCDGFGARPPYPTLMPYSPGETFKKCANFGTSAPLAVIPMAKPGKRVPGSPPAPLHALDQDTGSECSTVDTAARAPPSPALGHAVARTPDAKATAPKHGSAAAARQLPAAPELPAAAESPALLPSAGSDGHDLGTCKPCAFMHTKGCASGADCVFCHLCGPGEKQRRQKEKRQYFGSLRQLQKTAAEALAH